MSYDFINAPAVASAMGNTPVQPSAQARGPRSAEFKSATPTFSKIVYTYDGKTNNKEVTRVGIDSIKLLIVAVQNDNKVTRSHFTPAEKYPTCHSSNGDYPDADSKSPQSPTCDVCRQNQPGSASDGGTRKACAYHCRAAVICADDPEQRLLLWTIPISSVFGDSKKAPQGKYNLFKYLEYLGSHHRTCDTIITQVEFDNSAATNLNKVTFQAVEAVSPALMARMADPEVIALAKAHTSNDGRKPVVDLPAALPPTALPAAAAAAAAPVAAVTDQSAVIAALMAQLAALQAAPAAAPAAAPVAAPAAPYVPPMEDAFAGVVWGDTLNTDTPVWASGFTPV